MTFHQTGPILQHPYRNDRVLRAYLERRLSATLWPELDRDLERFGGLVAERVEALGHQAESQPPRLIPFDPWGRRIDHIEVSEAWRELDRIAAREKLVALAYERPFGAHSRLVQFAKLYLYHPSSAIYSCPLAMTDGAARALELYGQGQPALQAAFAHLTSADPQTFWTSGQWMTERTGGSDVSETSTVARWDDKDGYRLYGDKWFTSATTSQMAMTLARCEGGEAGSRGLSLFYVALRDPQGHLQNITVHRLKDKLGTRALPTAELSMQGTPAILVGGLGDGVKKISSLFNITRVYNACCALGNMQRGFTLACDYAGRRRAFGKLLIDQPLHRATLADMQAETEAAFYLVFRAVGLLGKEECGEASRDESAVLRLLTPLAKLMTAKQAIACASETLEAFGGAGYVEDTGLPRLLRDSQVLAIWEGTTNVLSLDVLRALSREQAGPAFLADMTRLLEGVQDTALQNLRQGTSEAVRELHHYLHVTLPALSTDQQQAGARQLSLSLVQTYMACLLLREAQDDRRVYPAAARWCRRRLCQLAAAPDDAAHVSVPVL